MILAQFSLPWPPTVNNMRVPIHRGRSTRLITSGRARDYFIAAGKRMMEQRVVSMEYAGAVRIVIAAHPPDNRTRDISNLIKGIEDSIVKYRLIKDDAQVWDLRIHRGHIVKGGLCIITVAELDNEAGLPLAVA